MAEIPHFTTKRSLSLEVFPKSRKSFSSDSSACSSADTSEIGNTFWSVRTPRDSSRSRFGSDCGVESPTNQLSENLSRFAMVSPTRFSPTFQPTSEGLDFEVVSCEGMEPADLAEKLGVVGELESTANFNNELTYSRVNPRDDSEMQTVEAQSPKSTFGRSKSNVSPSFKGSPERKSPDRKKIRCGISSPSRFLRRHSSNKHSSILAPIPVNTTPPRIQFSRCHSTPVVGLGSPFQIQESRKKLDSFAHECNRDCISVESMVELLVGGYEGLYRKVIIFDCRFNYEFEGGHIEARTPWLLVYHIPPDSHEIAKNLLFGERNLGQDVDSPGDICIILHCEFSKSRGPALFKFIRSIDRKSNSERYPYLSYPEMYLMKGGYNEFFSKNGGSYQKYCSPMCYVPMDDKNFRTQLLENNRKRGCRKHCGRPNSTWEEPIGLDGEV